MSSSSSQQEQQDSLLIALAQQSGSVQNLLDAVFSFLKRKTDFYIEQKPGELVGFPPGVAETIVFNAFKKYQDDSVVRGPTKDMLLAEAERIVTKEDADKLKKIRQETATTSDNHNKDNNEQQQQQQQQPFSKAAAATNDDNAFSTYNGGITDKYRWQQTLTDLVVQIDLFEEAGKKKLKGKDVTVVIKKQHLTVGVKGKPAFVDGDLHAPVLFDDFAWSLEDGRYVHINLDKVTQTWWACAIKGDPEINTQEVDSTRHITEYDEETQATIRKIMFDQSQKAQGLPTSEEMKNQELLRKAWNAPGSPFQGTPFDPSLVNINDNSTPNAFIPPNLK